MLGPNKLKNRKQPSVRRKTRRPPLTNIMSVIGHDSAQRFKFKKEQKHRNFTEAGTEILPGKLYLTSVYEAENPSYLTQNNITAILTINSNPLNPEISASIVHKYIRLGDNCTEMIEDYFDEMTDFIENNACVLVHCYAGVSRSATAVLAYLMKSMNIRLDGALLFLKSRRHVACPNFSFLGQLKSYEERLISSTQTARKQSDQEWRSQEDRDSGVESGDNSSDSSSLPPAIKKQKMTISDS